MKKIAVESLNEENDDEASNKVKTENLIAFMNGNKYTLRGTSTILANGMNAMD